METKISLLSRLANLARFLFWSFLIVHTPDGLVLAASQIAHALKNHKGKVTVFVPHYAMRGGTFISLAANEIVMDPNAVLGPVDPQMGVGRPSVNYVPLRRSS